MKINNYSILALIGLACIWASSGFTSIGTTINPSPKNDTLYIKDGKGVNGIVFDSSSMEDIQKVFGKGTIVKTPPATATSPDIVRLNYHGGYLKNGHGLEFLFRGENG